MYIRYYKVSRTSWSHHEFIMYTWQSDFLMPVLQQVHDHWPTSSHMKPELFQATGREPQVLQVSSVLENGLVPTSWAGQVFYWKLALSERHRRVCKSATRSSTGRSTSTTSLHEIILYKYVSWKTVIAFVMLWLPFLCLPVFSMLLLLDNEAPNATQ